MKFDHIGVVMKNLERGRQVLADVLNVQEWTPEITDPINGVRLQFGRDPSGICYELLEPLGVESPVYPALAERRAILNHVAYLVDDLEAGAARLAKAKCARSGDPKPAIAYGGRRIQFFVTPLRFIVELIEAPAHEHAFTVAFPFEAGSR